jgi:hypothetical protein
MVQDVGNEGDEKQKGWPPLHSGYQPSGHLSVLCAKFLYFTFSLRLFPALNFTTFDAGILIFSPVPGLRPLR